MNANHPLRPGPLGPLARRWLCAVCLCLALVGSGCAAAWETVTPVPGEGSATRPAATRTPRATPTSDAVVPPAPGEEAPPSAFLASLTLTDAPVQSWTNPNDVRALAWEAGALWAATSGGVVRWEIAAGRYEVFGVREGLASPATNAMAVDADGHIWVGYAGLDAWSEFDGVAWHTYTRRDAVIARYPAMRDARQFSPRMWARSPQSGWLWFPTADGQVRAYDGETMRSYGPYEGVRRDTAFVAVAGDGRVWAVGDGVSTVLEGYRWWEDHSLFAEIPRADAVTSVAMDAQGRLWIGFVGQGERGGGICSLDLGQQRWTGHLADMNPEIPAQVHDILIDATGTVWLAGEGATASHRPGEMWRSVGLAGRTAQCLVRDEFGRQWLGTSHGIWVVSRDGRKVEGPWLVPAPFSGGEVAHLVVDSEGRLFIGTPQGVAHALPAGPTGILLEEAPRELDLGPDGALWMGTATGLYVAKAPALEAAPRLADAVTALTVDATGAAWVCTEDRRLLRLGPEGDLTSLATLDDLHIASLTALAVGADGTLWLATPLGLGARAPDGAYRLYTRDDGLPDMDVRDVAIAPTGEVWVGTANGLARLSPDGRWTRFTPESTEGGLRSEALVDLYMEPDGTLWLATQAGLSVRSPAADWAYLDLPGVLCVYPQTPPGGGATEVVWVGGQGGLHRVACRALQAIP